MYNGFDPNSQNNDFYNKRVQLDGFNTITIKGQLISNGLLGIFNSSKSEKSQKKNHPNSKYTYDTSGRFVFVRFLDELRISKRPFEIN